MKIFQIIPSLSSGGAERFTVDISNKLSRDYIVYLVQIYSGESDNLLFYKSQLSNKVKYINLNGTHKKQLEARTLFRLIKTVNKIKPDVIHSHLNVLYSMFLFLFFKKITFFHTIHNDADVECLKVKGLSIKKILKLYYRNRYIVPITISKKSKNSFKNFYRLNTSVLIENGCNKMKATKNIENVKLEIEKLKNNRNKLIFINIGRCQEQKNHSMLIEVFNRLISEGEEIILLIIGSGFDSKKGTTLKNKSKKNIHFLGEKENISDYLLCADAFCLSSLWEGLPISLLEAMSVGCFPICTPAGGIPNVLDNNNLGYVSKGFSKDEYYKSIKLFIKTHDSIDKRLIINHFTKNYSIENTVTKLKKNYKHENTTTNI